MIRFRGTLQCVTLALFLFLLLSAIYSVDARPLLDLFLRLDPSVAIFTAISTRDFIGALVPAAVVVLFTLGFGRIFCGYICPMGTTLDGGEKCFLQKKKKEADRGSLRGIKYLVLLFLLGASLFGVSWVFIASPLSLITRFYGLLVHPLLSFLFTGAYALFLPIAEWADFRSLLFLQTPTPRFDTQIFLFVFFLTLFALVRISPRFWCRNLCPSGALLALISRKPLIRRRVSPECTQCGKCVRACPMGAIPEANPMATLHEECIVCRTCEGTCPVSAISFTFSKHPGDQKAPLFLPGRRKVILYGLLGAGSAVVNITGLRSPYGKSGPGQVLPVGLLRPPGAFPEGIFLSRCVRCGECMAACPTNTLQPIWLEAGFMGLFSPAMTPRRGYCNPECHRCAEVCPTEAIPKLDSEERVWARTGTAIIFRQRCLAWEHQKSCMVCDEVCPFKAVEFRNEPGNPVPVPQVLEDRCAGCGYCEHFCPVQNQAAIVVTPMGAIRLAKGSYREEAKRLGLQLSMKNREDSEYPSSGTAERIMPAPGFEQVPDK